jgi:hypothetical protein
MIGPKEIDVSEMAPQRGLTTGEWVTCENGHHIARVAKPVAVGDRINEKLPLSDWTTSEPQLGAAQVEPCRVCGGAWWGGGHVLHFEDGWR